MLPIEMISVTELDNYIGRKDTIIIDLREPWEYEEQHIKTAVNIPYERVGECKQFSHNKELIFYCERGSSSLLAARELRKKGYRTKSVAGGIRCYRGSNLFFSTEHSRIKMNKR